MRIGELSRATGVAASRIRFYEAHRLLPAPDRHANGYRDYPDGAVETLLFIRQAQDLGFSLKEIGSVLPGVYGPRADCGSVLASLRHKLGEVDDHIARSLQVKADLLALIGRLEARRAKTAHPAGRSP